MGKKNKTKNQPVGVASSDNSEAPSDTILHDGKLWERVRIPGLMDAYRVKATIQAAIPSMEYLGPLIPIPLWMQVLSYFKWANDSHHCEVQVRGFINREQSLWKFWAFPQEKGGMTTKELPGEDFDNQRAAIGPGWEEFLSAHSHCSMSAFQSSVDHSDEVDRPGLHITIGKLDQKVFDIDARASFIYQGSRVHYKQVNLSEWFDDPDFMRDAPAGLIKSLSDEVLSSIHKQSLTSLPDGIVDFPEQWRLNLRDRPPFTPAASAGGVTHHKTYPSYPGAASAGSHQGYLGFNSGGNENGLLWDLIDISHEYNLSSEEMAELLPFAEKIKKALSENSFWDWDKAIGVVEAAIVTNEWDEMEKLRASNYSSGSTAAAGAEQPICGAGETWPD